MKTVVTSHDVHKRIGQLSHPRSKVATVRMRSHSGAAMRQEVGGVSLAVLSGADQSTVTAVTALWWFLPMLMTVMSVWYRRALIAVGLRWFSCVHQYEFEREMHSPTQN